MKMITFPVILLFSLLFANSGLFLDAQPYSMAFFGLDVISEKLHFGNKNPEPKPFEKLEGVMIMQVYNSDSELVAYIKSNHFKVLKNDEIKQFISSWPVEYTISKDGKEYQVLHNTFQSKITDEMETRGHFTLNKSNDSKILFLAKHPQIHVVKGDMIYYDVRIFQPVF